MLPIFISMSDTPMIENNNNIYIYIYVVYLKTQEIQLVNRIE